MANYSVRFSCGHEGTVSLFGKNSDREKKIKWYEENGLCTECYKSKKRAEEAAVPLTLNHTINALRVDDATGEPIVILSFSGNAYEVKDKIKALGYMWCDSYPSDFKTSVISTGYAWRKEIKLSELEAETEKAKNMGAVINAKGISDDMEALNLQNALRLQEKWKEKQALKAKINKPEAPFILKGHRWNNTVYGVKGRYRVYLDGNETYLTDEQADEVKKYVAAKIEYKKKIAELEEDLK